MGAAVGTDDKKSVNVDLNVIPFIDLMSCLTAFLLVTAVWTNLAQIEIKPKGQGQSEPGTEEWVKASVLITESDVHVGLSRVQDISRVPKLGDQYDWAKVREILDGMRRSSYLQAPNPYAETIEIGAEDKVEYQAMVTAMDTSLAVGFKDVGLSSPNELSAKFVR
jgi:biopolymer transport protein ExbD